MPGLRAYVGAGPAPADKLGDRKFGNAKHEIPPIVTPCDEPRRIGNPGGEVQDVDIPAKPGPVLHPCIAPDPVDCRCQSCPQSVRCRSARIGNGGDATWVRTQTAEANPPHGQANGGPVQGGRIASEALIAWRNERSMRLHGADRQVELVGPMHPVPMPGDSIGRSRDLGE